MRRLLFLLAICAFALSAQDGRGGGRGGAPHTNLKVLPDDANLIPTMRAAVAALGVMGCDYCHAQDRASDEKPTKVMARMMFSMVKDINAKFPDGKMHVTCYTCHRGAQEPLTAPPAQ
jgi:Photosynthetic reaction centre cytochrome C subunit